MDSLAYNLVIAEDHERKERGTSPSGGRSIADFSSNASGRDIMEYLDVEEDD